MALEAIFLHSALTRWRLKEKGRGLAARVMFQAHAHKHIAPPAQAKYRQCCVLFQHQVTCGKAHAQDVMNQAVRVRDPAISAIEY